MINRLPRLLLVLGAINGFLTVALGAFGAHALKRVLDERALGWWQTAVHYHGVHALALLATGVLALHLTRAAPPPRALRVAGWGFLIGITLFCGSLYLMALSGVRALGAVTPLGGLSLLVAWAALAISANSMKDND